MSRFCQCLTRNDWNMIETWKGMSQICTEKYQKILPRTSRTTSIASVYSCFSITRNTASAEPACSYSRISGTYSAKYRHSRITQKTLIPRRTCRISSCIKDYRAYQRNKYSYSHSKIRIFPRTQYRLPNSRTRCHNKTWTHA